MEKLNKPEQYQPETQFSQIQRLASFARNKINETHSDKTIKILAFGHEVYYLGRKNDWARL